MGTCFCWTQEKQNKEKKRHASPAVSRKEENAKHRFRWCRTPTNAKIRIPSVGKIQRGISEKTQRKKTGIDAAARVSRTPRQSNIDVSRTEKKKRSRWSVSRDGKIQRAQLVRSHAPSERRANVSGDFGADVVRLAASAEAIASTGTFALSSGRVLHIIGAVLAEGEGLRTEKLWARLDLGHAAFAGLLVTLVVHLNIVLRVALAWLLTEEAAVSSIEDVHLRESEAGVVLHVDVAVVATNELGGERSTVDGVFAVKDDESVRWVSAVFEECIGEQLLVVKVDGAFDVATVVFVFKSAVDDDDLLVLAVVLGIKNVGHGFLGNTGQAIGVVVGNKVGKLERVFLLDLHHGSELGSRRQLEDFLFFLHHIVGVLEHTERAANLFARRTAHAGAAIGGLANVASAWRA